MAEVWRTNAETPEASPRHPNEERSRDLEPRRSRPLPLPRQAILPGIAQPRRWAAAWELR